MRSINNLIEDLSERVQRCADAERSSVPATFTFVPVYYRDLERLIDEYKKMRADWQAMRGFVEHAASYWPDPSQEDCPECKQCVSILANLKCKE